MLGRLMLLVLVLALAGCASSPPDGAPAAASAPAEMPGPAICKADLAVCRASSCEGWVFLRFDISGLGDVSNPVVTNACPPGFFDKAALQVIEEWSYPQEQAGRRGVTVRLDFRKPR
jgi:TonB family protein